MNINEIYGLMDRFDASSLSELNIEIGGVKLGMKKDYGQPTVPNSIKEVTKACETTSNVESNVINHSSSNDIEKRLKSLQSLYDQCLITKDEYEEKKQEILKEL